MCEELFLKFKKILEEDFEIQGIVKNGSDLTEITNRVPRDNGA